MSSKPPAMPNTPEMIEVIKTDARMNPPVSTDKVDTLPKGALPLPMLDYASARFNARPIQRSMLSRI